jgi:DNA-binding transcriptional regulator YdaS (Cro superfamily)
MNIALKFAIQKIGNQATLARALGISSQAITQWGKVPPTRVIEIERLTGVNRSDLRPDIYPPEPQTRFVPPVEAKVGRTA